MRLLFPGSFDPPHHGHVDVLARAAALAGSCGGEVLVGVADNPEKRGHLTVEHRLELLGSLCLAHPNVRAVTFRGATVHFARSAGVTALVRGLRHGADLEGEKAMAEVNRRHGLDTIFFVTDARWSFLSSGLVRGVHAAGLPLSELVPAEVQSALERLRSSPGRGDQQP